MNPLKAIRQNCIECSGGSKSEADRCHISSCPLHPFRHGKNPYRTVRVMTDEQKLAATLRLQLAREKRTTTEDRFSEP